MQFHAKYPLFDSQSDREFTFSYAILRNIQVKYSDTFTEIDQSLIVLEIVAMQLVKFIIVVYSPN